MKTKKKSSGYKSPHLVQLAAFILYPGSSYQFSFPLKRYLYGAYRRNIRFFNACAFHFPLSGTLIITIFSRAFLLRLSLLLRLLWATSCGLSCNIRSRPYQSSRKAMPS